MTTQLSVTATPGPEHSFAPKGSTPRPGDRITGLSVIGTPGGLRVFEPKGPIEPPPVDVSVGSGHRDGWYSSRKRDAERNRAREGLDARALLAERIRADDEELLTVIMAAMKVLE